jgi:hypothetical protein
MTSRCDWKQRSRFRRATLSASRCPRLATLQRRPIALLDAVSPQGRGVLVRLRYGDSLVAGDYAVTAPGDSLTVPGAQVAVRYLVREVTHGFAVDSGSVQVRRSGAAISVRIVGSGLENAIRTPTWIDFWDVPLTPTADTVPCEYQP